MKYSQSMVVTITVITISPIWLLFYITFDGIGTKRIIETFPQ